MFTVKSDQIIDSILVQTTQSSSNILPKWILSSYPQVQYLPFDDDVFYLFFQKQNLGAKLHIYLEEGTYPKNKVDSLPSAPAQTTVEQQHLLSSKDSEQVQNN
jgi:hypothetical protein